MDMPERGKSVHVATTRRRYKDRIYETHLLRRTFRKDGKVKHQTLGNLSHLPTPAIDAIRKVLKGETLVSALEQFQNTKSLPHGHVAAILGTLRNLGIDKLLGSKRTQQRELVTSMIVARILNPGSKLATARAVATDTAQTSLGEVLGLEDTNEDQLYAAMDWLLPKQARIEKELAKRHLDNTLVLYDVTSTYFEGRTCPLAKRGYSRDKKRGKLQIVIGLLCSREGCPVAVEVFDGNTADPATLAPQIKKLRERFGLDRVVLVGDRGMLTEARIREEVEPVEGLSWISALRAPAIQGLARQGAIQLSLFDEVDLVEITAPDFPDERLIVCRNPLLAEERARKRTELLEATEREFDKIVRAVQRKRQPLKGTDAIGLRVGGVRNKYKVGKHFELTITDDSFSYARRQQRIEEEAVLDGLYVVRTDVTADELSAEEVVSTYKSLSVVERAFRTMKTVDLKLRPIHHRREDRVRTHAFLCMLAYYVEWHMRKALAPLLFEDHAKVNAERSSVVSKAKRSPAADRKAATQRTEDGFPTQSFRCLLDQLGTIVKNRVQPVGAPESAFTMTTLPSPHQKRAFELLEVSIST